MSQKQHECPLAQPQAPQKFVVSEAPAESTDLLEKINAAVTHREDDPLVWVCSTRLISGGCLRPMEGRPPNCPVYSTEKDPLFVSPLRVHLSFVKHRLTTEGHLAPGQEPFDGDNLTELFEASNP